MKYKITEAHNNNNPIPLTINRGTRVKLGERSDGIESWPNWIHCCTLDGTSEGWAPVQLIQIEDEYGIALEDYSAKELVVVKGDIVEGNIELNGWIWCNKLHGLEKGWLPKEKMTTIADL